MRFVVLILFIINFIFLNAMEIGKPTSIALTLAAPRLKKNGNQREHTKRIRHNLQKNSAFLKQWQSNEAVSLIRAYIDFFGKRPTFWPIKYRTPAEQVFEYQLQEHLEKSNINLLALIRADSLQPSIAWFTIIIALANKACKYIAQSSINYGSKNTVYFNFLNVLDTYLDSACIKSLSIKLLKPETNNYLQCLYVTQLSIEKTLHRCDCAFSFDGTMLAILTDGKINFYSASDCKLIPEKKLKTSDTVQFFEFSPDGQHCAAIETKDSFSGACCYKLKGNEFIPKVRLWSDSRKPYIALAFSPSGCAFAISTQNTVSVIDVEKSETIHSINIPLSKAMALCFNKDEEFLAVQTPECIYCLDLIAKNWTRLQSAGESTCFVNNELLYVNSQNIMTTYCLEKKDFNYLIDNDSIKKVFWNDVAQIIAFIRCEEPDNLYLGFKSHRKTIPLSQEQLLPIENVVFSNNGETLVTVHTQNILVVWDIQKMICLGHCNFNKKIQKVLMHPISNTILVQDEEGALFAYCYQIAFMKKQLSSCSLVQTEIVNGCSLLKSIDELLTSLNDELFRCHYFSLGLQFRECIEQYLLSKSSRYFSKK